MATVRLFFEPFPEAGAISLRIEESADGISGWSEIENISAIGTFPDYISSYQTTNAVSAQAWFRIRWETTVGLQGYSDPLQADALPIHYTVPDLVKEGTRIIGLQTLATGFIQDLVLQSYYMLQHACGPFDETNPDFIIIAPIAARMYVEYLFITSDPSNLAALGGVIQEKIGSYMVRRSDKSVELYSDMAGEVPDNIKALVCRFTTADDDTPVETITTSVFTHTPWVDGEEEDLDKGYVVTSADPQRVALDSDALESKRYKKEPSV